MSRMTPDSCVGFLYITNEKFDESKYEGGRIVEVLSGWP